MDTREKLEVIAHLGDHITYREGIGICYDSALAKVIEDAYMELKNGVTVQEWIPVSEPPEENGYYWCYVLTSCVCDKKVYEQMPLYWEDDVWLYRHNSYRMCKNVTRWMTLPEPPKGE